MGAREVGRGKLLVARYYPVSALFWNDRKVLSWPERERYLALYLLTSSHRNLEGLFRLPKPYIQDDLDWPIDEVSEHLDALIEAGFVKYDEAAKVILLPKAMKYHQPKSKNQIQGAINALQEIPPTELWPDFMAAAQAFAPEFFDALQPLSTGSAVEIEEEI